MAPSRLDRARLSLRQMGIAIDWQSLVRKELPFLQHKHRAAHSPHDDLWRWNIGELKKTVEQQEWGEVPGEVARALVECRRNRSDTRFHVPRLWDLWPRPLQQLDQDWDEVRALRREARVWKPSRRRLPSPPEVKELVADRPPMSAAAGSDLAQLQQLLTQCLGRPGFACFIRPYPNQRSAEGGAYALCSPADVDPWRSRDGSLFG